MSERLTKRELAVLQLLLKWPDAMYGREIAKQVYPRWFHWIATIYVVLSRLEDRGLIAHSLEQVPAGYRGLPRYLYRITDHGRLTCNSQPIKDALMRPT